MTSLLTELPSTPFAIVMPDEFSEVTDITIDRRNSTSINPTTQSMSTEQANAQNQLKEQIFNAFDVPAGSATSSSQVQEDRGAAKLLLQIISDESSLSSSWRILVLA